MPTLSAFGAFGSHPRGQRVAREGPREDRQVQDAVDELGDLTPRATPERHGELRHDMVGVLSRERREQDVLDPGIDVLFQAFDVVGDRRFDGHMVGVGARKVAARPALRERAERTRLALLGRLLYVTDPVDAVVLHEAVNARAELGDRRRIRSCALLHKLQRDAGQAGLTQPIDPRLHELAASIRLGQGLGPRRPRGEALAGSDRDADEESIAKLRGASHGVAARGYLCRYRSRQWCSMEGAFSDP